MLIRTIAFLVSAGAMLAACTTMPPSFERPDVATQIRSNAVAYNEAYGRAIADQVLLNALRARDRLPLYHLSMSGITEGSELTVQRTMGIGSITLGGEGSPWGVGSIQGQRTASTQPSYVLNPFSSDPAHPRARQFEPLSEEVFRHFWTNDWPRELLILAVVDDMTPVDARNRTTGDRLENNSANYRGDCQPAPAVADRTQPLRERCGFIWAVHDFLDDPATTERLETGSHCVTPPRAAGENAPAPQPRCNVRLVVERPRPTRDPVRVAAYELRMRGIDDMIYFMGSLLRGQDEADAASPLLVRPSGVYPSDTERWRDIERTAAIFRVTRAPERPLPRAQRPAPGYYAAEVTYRGERYQAGPANDRMCVGASSCRSTMRDENDVTSTMLSLLTQIVIISQSEQAQLGPTPLEVRD